MPWANAGLGTSDPTHRPLSRWPRAVISLHVWLVTVVYDIEIDPDNPNKVCAATPHGILWPGGTTVSQSIGKGFLDVQLRGTAGQSNAAALIIRRSVRDHHADHGLSDLDGDGDDPDLGCAAGSVRMSSLQLFWLHLPTSNTCAMIAP